MKLKLDYTIKDIDERLEIVREICSANESELTNKNLDTLSNYLVYSSDKNEKKKREITTKNRLATVKKRETSLESLTAKFISNEDKVYQIFHDDKNRILTPAVSITPRDIETIPFLAQIREAIAQLKTLPIKNYIVYQAIINLSQTQYIVKNAYVPSIKINSHVNSAPMAWDWNNLVDFTKWHHCAALLKHYADLKTKYYGEIERDMFWILYDFENVTDAALKDKEPILYDIVKTKIDGHTNLEIQAILEQEHGKTFSVEYISSLFNNKIPKLIAIEAEKEELLWYYTEVEKGKWKKCSRCGQIKLLHPIFFSKNSSSTTGYYSICKECRNSKTKK